MTPELSRRLARALDLGQASVDQRQSVVQAVKSGVSSFDDLPPDIRALVELLESGPSTQGEDGP